MVRFRASLFYSSKCVLLGADRIADLSKKNIMNIKPDLLVKKPVSIEQTIRYNIYVGLVCVFFIKIKRILINNFMRLYI